MCRDNDDNNGFLLLAAMSGMQHMRTSPATIASNFAMEV